MADMEIDTPPPEQSQENGNGYDHAEEFSVELPPATISRSRKNRLQLLRLLLVLQLLRLLLFLRRLLLL